MAATVIIMRVNKSYRAATELVTVWKVGTWYDYIMNEHSFKPSSREA